MTLQFRGALTMECLPGLWASSLDKVRVSKPSRLIIDLSSVSNLDGAGLGLLAEVRRAAVSWGGELTLQGVRGELSSLVQMSALSDPRAAILIPPEGQPWIVSIGVKVKAFLQELRDQVVFTGELLEALAWALRNPRLIRFRDLWLAAEKAGVNALPIIFLLGLLIGMIVAFLAASVLQSFGAISMIPMIVSIGMVREFAPLMTAVFLAGRAGSFYAAELGTMKITEELDALESFGLNKMRFLVVPRVLASMLTMPMLTVFFIFAGLIGGYAVCKIFGIGLPTYISAVRENVDYIDLLGSLAKSVIFAVLVSSIGCLRGFQTGRGPGAVGVSTTRSLVTAVAMIVVADGMVGAVYYFLGI
jgi:phospholipid/cholesterol/gamma-HCH transport system permease protein